MEAGAPVIERMRAGYWGLIHDASLDLEKLVGVFRQRRDPAGAAHRAARPLCGPAAVNQGRLGRPIQLRCKLVVVFEPRAEFSDGDVVLVAIVALHFIEILRVGFD